MSFQEVLNQLLKAIEKKNFKQLEACLPPEGPIAAIMCDGTVLEDVEDYLEFHKEWFEDGEWSITHDIVFTEETTEMSYAVVENEYFDKDDDEYIGRFIIDEVPLGAIFLMLMTMSTLDVSL